MPIAQGDPYDPLNGLRRRRVFLAWYYESLDRDDPEGPPPEVQ